MNFFDTQRGGAPPSVHDATSSCTGMDERRPTNWSDSGWRLYFIVNFKRRSICISAFYLDEEPGEHSKNKTPVVGNAIPLGVKPKQVWYVFWLFLKIGPCSAVSLKRSRRELSINVAEHRSMLKIYRNTLYPRFSFIPKTGIAFPVFTVSRT